MIWSGKEYRIFSKIERPELALVVIMLFCLVALVFIVLLIPLGPPAGVGSYNETSMMDLTNSILKSRTEILTIIITAFGAWVGAGAAYFFGRENLKQATEGMLLAINSPRQRLQNTKIKSLPPHILKMIVKISDALDPIFEKVKKDADIWFIPVVNDKGILETVIHEEALYRYKLEPDAKSDATIQDLRKFVESDKNVKKEVEDFWIEMNMDDDFGTAEILMARAKARIAIIVDANRVPTHVISTGDIRRVLLKE